MIQLTLHSGLEIYRCTFLNSPISHPQPSTPAMANWRQIGASKPEFQESNHEIVQNKLRSIIGARILTKKHSARSPARWPMRSPNHLNSQFYGLSRKTRPKQLQPQRP